MTENAREEVKVATNVNDPNGGITAGFEALHALYSNKQQWVRHYETLLSQLIPISTAASLGILAYIAENRLEIELAKAFMLVPVLIISFTVWFTGWCDTEIKRQFDQIVSAEVGMGFYKITVNRGSVHHVLPKEYMDSPVTTRPIVKAGYVSQIVSFIALLIAVNFVFFN